MLAAKEGIDLASADEKAVTNQLTELPAFAEVPGALGQRRAAKFRLVALTNGAYKSALAQLEHAGSVDRFEAVFSAEEVERFKPGKLPLAAAHAWNVAGAYQAGLSTAFVARPRQVLNPLATEPDHAAKDLAGLAAKLC